MPTALRQRVVAIDDDLLALAIDLGTDAYDSLSYEELIASLRQRETPPTCATIVPLLDDERVHVRAFALDVLSDLACPETPLTDRLLATMGALPEIDRSPRTLIAVHHAEKQIRSALTGLDVLLARVHHADRDVRLAVARALDADADPREREGLVALSRDVDGEVRNWATFGLVSASQAGSPVDSLEIREALLARLDDPHEETRAEAVLGLARRGDRRVLPTLIVELESGLVEWGHYLEAARHLAAPELCAALQDLTTWEASGLLEFWRQWGLDEAIEACCGECAGTDGTREG